MTAPSYISVPERLKISTEQFNQMKWQLLCDLRVASPGIVKSFDPVKQTVSVQLAIRENIVQDAVTTPVAISILQDLPIVIPRAGGFALTFPIKAGDECLVVFADNCIDSWWQSGGVQNQIDRRRHDLSDGFAVLGCFSQRRVLPNYSTSSAQLRTDDGAAIVDVAGTKVTVTANQVDINGGGKVNINSIDVHITGSSDVIITGAGNVGIDGRNFLSHSHTGVTTGAGISGPVL